MPISSDAGSAMVGLRSKRRSAAGETRGRGARHAFAGVDVKARRALEPAAAVSEKRRPSLGRSKVTLATMVSAHHLEVEARLDRLVGETQLHQRRLEQTRRSFSSGRSSAASSPRMSTAG
jgi:hypothetical protein